MLTSPKLFAAALLGSIFGRATPFESFQAQPARPRLNYAGAPLSLSHWSTRVLTEEPTWDVYLASVFIQVSSIIEPVPGAPDTCEVSLSFAIPRPALIPGRVLIASSDATPPEFSSEARIDGRVRIEGDSPFCPPLETLSFDRIVLRVDRVEAGRVYGYVQGRLARRQVVFAEENCTGLALDVKPGPELSFSVALDGVYVE